MSLTRFVEYLQGIGCAVPDDAVERYYANEYGEPPREWTQAERKSVKKAVAKTLDLYADRFLVKPSADEIVDHLWRVGWEIREFRGTVYGHEKYVKTYIDNHFPKDDAPLSRAEQEDPYLEEVRAVLQLFRVEPTDRECRMIVRDPVDPKWIRYACELFKSWGYSQDMFTVGNIMKTAKEKYETKNHRYVFDI